MRSLGKRVRA